jgi:hypothetical protein
VLGSALLVSSVLGLLGRGPRICDARVGAAHTGLPCFRNPPARWTEPAALVLCALGLAGGAAVLLAKRSGPAT